MNVGRTVFILLYEYIFDNPVAFLALNVDQLQGHVYLLSTRRIAFPILTTTKNAITTGQWYHRISRPGPRFLA